MKKSRILVTVSLILCAIALIAWFLPFISVNLFGDPETLSGTKLASMAFEDLREEGVTIVISLFFAVAAFVAAVTAMIKPRCGIAVLAAGCISPVLMLAAMISLEMLDYGGAGFWTFFIADLSAAALAAAAYFRPVIKKDLPVKEAHHKCPNCANTIPADVGFCPFCGNAVNGSAGPLVPTPETPDEPVSKLRRMHVAPPPETTPETPDEPISKLRRMHVAPPPSNDTLDTSAEAWSQAGDDDL